MREIQAQQITDVVEKLCIEANQYLPKDVQGAIRRCRACAGEIARAQGWAVVNCAEGGAPRTPEDIHREVASIVNECLSR